MILYYDNRFRTILFGISHLKDALRVQQSFILERELHDYTGPGEADSVVAFIGSYRIYIVSPDVEPGGFEISRNGNTILVGGKDPAGVMYGLLDLAETIRNQGMPAVKEKLENSFLPFRGIKFNLPFEPYDMGDPFLKNIDTCLDPEYWRSYIDFLAMNRYNCLSLWAEHPFHMMFRLDKYPETCPYTDTQLEAYKNLFKFIFAHAKDRGIDVYLITWNIRLTPFVAKGLGLPVEMGDMEDRYRIIYDHQNGIANNVSDLDSVRQHSEKIQDYFRECIKTLIMTYRDLTGIGTTCSEEMTGDAVERHQWVVDTYLRAIEEAGRDIPFIHRTNMSNGGLAKKMFMDQYPFAGKFISWKYSNAHMYSHPLPQFEKLWGAWDDTDLNGIKIIYTVRNDDFHTLRWGDPEFISQYVKGMKKPHVHGFYWGSDGYLWGDDFQHVPHGHKTWRYDFERHWMEFALLGRLGYNPDLSDSVWIDMYKEHYGDSGSLFFKAMQAASRIIPAVNRLFWINYDFDWHAESLLSVLGFKSILDFMDGKTMPGISTTSIGDFVNHDLAGLEQEGETPADILVILRDASETAREAVAVLKATIPAEYKGGETQCALLDLEAWAWLGEYYWNKFAAAIDLARLDRTGNETFRGQAVQKLEAGLAAWKELSAVWSTHYMPYMMTRSKYVFGWPYYTPEVEKDIVLAQKHIPRLKGKV